MFTLLSSGPSREIWYSDVFEGGTEAWLETNIVPENVDVSGSIVYLYVDAASGEPLLATPELDVNNGFLRVHLRNSALPGNTATATLDVWYRLPGAQGEAAVVKRAPYP